MRSDYIPAGLRRLVRERAGECCEYCLTPEAFVLLAHEVDHVVAQKHGGDTAANNLALSCIQCNRHKGSDLASIDPETGETVLLYHPRRDEWSLHFRLAGGLILPLTAVGRATAQLLQFNQHDRVLERASMVAAGILTPP